MSIVLLELRVDHARLKIVDRLQLKAIRMKAKADGITVEQFSKALAKQTREFYRQKLFPTKFGPVKAYLDENGAWMVSDLWRGSQRYTLKRVLDENLYTHTRAYLMGLVLSEKGQNDKRWGPETVILRGDDKVAVVKRGKLKLSSWNEWIGRRGKRKRERSKRAGENRVRGKRRSRTG